jgi:hypothetical protein
LCRCRRASSLKYANWHQPHRNIGRFPCIEVDDDCALLRMSTRMRMYICLLRVPWLSATSTWFNAGHVRRCIVRWCAVRYHARSHMSHANGLSAAGVWDSMCARMARLEHCSLLHIGHFCRLAVDGDISTSFLSVK